jgi:hypothetical protein
MKKNIDLRLFLLLSSTGVGSFGNETTLLGLKTWNAIKRFQNYYKSTILTPYGLTKPTGFVGMATLAKIRSLIGQ